MRLYLLRRTLVVLTAGIALGGTMLQAQTPTAAVIATIQIPAADIVGLSVGDSGELAVYDRTPAASNSLIRFFQASLDEGHTVVTAVPEAVTLLGDAPGFKGWMLRDAGLLYALAVRSQNTDDWGSSTYQQMWLYVIAGHSTLKAINYNNTAVVEGGKPVYAPEDFRYAVNGFTHKPAGAEGGNNLRIVIDDTLKGNLDILDLDGAGTSLASQERVSYRARHESGCQWPGLDPGPFYTCGWFANIGNGLALDWTLDTRSSPSDPTLASDDDLYILDPIYTQSKLRRIKLSHPGAPYSAVPQPEIDLEAVDFFLGNGVESLHAAPDTDRLWIATGLQSFAEGYVPVLDTLHLSTDVVDPVYSDEDIILVDPGDHGRVFIPVSDAFASPSTLVVRELQDGVVANSVAALTDYDPYSLDAAAFDRAFGLVYLAIGDTIYAVEVTEPDPPWIFSDGFESGNVSVWSGSSI